MTSPDYNKLKAAQLEYFGGDFALAAEYSVVKTCPLSDSGYHCSCYDGVEGDCDICGEVRTYK